MTRRGETRRGGMQGSGVSLLLLGPAQSGKSTFFRQLQLMHGKCFTTLEEKTAFRHSDTKSKFLFNKLGSIQNSNFDLSLFWFGVKF